MQMQIQTAEDVRSYLRAQGDVFHQTANLADQIYAIGRKIVEWWREGYQFLGCGCGGTEAEISHASAEAEIRLRSDDLRPPFSFENLGAEQSSLTAGANDLGFEEYFAQRVRAKGWAQKRSGAKFVLFAVSTSGTTKAVIRAIEVAKELGMPTVGITCASADKPVAKLANYSIVVPVDPNKINPTQANQVANLTIWHIWFEMIAAEWTRMEAEDKKVSSVLPDYPSGSIGPVNSPTLSTISGDQPMTSRIYRPPFGSTEKPDPERLLAVVDKFPQQSILVAGDVMLDLTIEGYSERLCPEAPVPDIFITSNDIICRPGGAANVAANVKDLDGEPFLWGIVNSDGKKPQLINAAWGLHSALEKSDIQWIGEEDHLGETTTKMRIYTKTASAGEQMVCRVSIEVQKPHPPQYPERLRRYYRGIAVPDYGKGAVTPELMTMLLPMAAESQLPIIVDPKPRSGEFDYRSLYSGLTVLKPNIRELQALTKTTVDKKDDNQIGRIGLDYARNIKSDLIITRGELGCTICQIDGLVSHLKASHVENPSVEGAGDTFTAALILALAAEADLISAAHIALIACYLSVSKKGTATVSQAELIEEINRRVAKREYPFD